MKKNAVLRFRVCEHERAIIAEMCRQESMNLSEMLRELIRKEAINRGLWTSIPAKRGGQGIDGKQVADHLVR